MRLWGKRLLMVFARLAIMAAAAVFLVLPAATLAAPLGNPLDAVTDSTPVSSFAAPAGYGKLTGADGDVSSAIWAATTDLGYLTYFNGSNSTPIKQVDTGISGLTGVAYRGVDQWALSAGKVIYEGTVTGTTWHTDKAILVLGLTSDLTDLDWALGAYFVSTGNDGIRKVNADGSSTQLIGGTFQSLDAIEFMPNTYDNPMMELNGNNFRNIDTSGIPFGVGALVNLNNPLDIQGIAYYGGSSSGMAVVQDIWVDMHNPEAYQQYIQPLPEPATVALLGIGGLAVLFKRRQSGLVVPSNIEDKKQG